MSTPYRGRTGANTYFITSNAYLHKRLLQADRSAGLLIEILYHYRSQKKFLLHEFVAMPNHLHLLISVGEITLERAMQFIKGSFSYRVKKGFGYAGEIWQTSFTDRRIRDAEEYAKYRDYIWQNPVSKGLCSSAGDCRTVQPAANLS